MRVASAIVMQEGIICIASLTQDNSSVPVSFIKMDNLGWKESFHA
ncbi:hypothetical protein CPter291_3651 [Collimonas pratensis]|uniref:Uncharacterized protein n=1 Tax=Collimonas pratensis TaxID=279113 RepID=A0A127Q7W1_9BURK|nr:hypothetical protein CPter91_3614 [Collimonas pratensis]AMP15885.1 hypothetical protein CPter291_3651 [Collimonas pratensis]